MLPIEFTGNDQYTLAAYYLILDVEEGNLDPKPTLQLIRAINPGNEDALADLEQQLAGVAAIK